MNARQKLQASPQIRDVAAMVQSGLFETCCDVALLTFVDGVGQTIPDPVIAASYQQQLAGAKRILSILKDLATIPEAPKPNRMGQLGPQ